MALATSMDREVGAVGEALLSLTDTGGLRLLDIGDTSLPKAGTTVHDNFYQMNDICAASVF